MRGGEECEGMEGGRSGRREKGRRKGGREGGREEEVEADAASYVYFCAASRHGNVRGRKVLTASHNRSPFAIKPTGAHTMLCTLLHAR